MTAGRHRLDGQRRDTWHAWLRDARAVIRLTWLVLTIPISRRVHGAAGGVTVLPPDGALGAPAAPVAPVRPAGASLNCPQLRPAAPEGVTAPATPGAATRPPWVWYAGDGPWPAQRGQHPYAAPAYGIEAFPLPGHLAVIDGTGAFAAISRPASPSLRDTGHLEALAAPAVREWATDTATLTRALDGLRALEVGA
jgi:hypothetical protein